MHLFTTFILSVFVTIGLVPIFKRMAFRMHLVDEPDARKVHLLPMPRSGGISMAIGAFLPVLIWVPMDNMVRAIHLGCAIIVIFGIIDDIRTLKYSQKLMAQIAASLVVMLYGGVGICSLGEMLPDGMDLPQLISFPLTLVFIVGVTNAINLSDGLDGLAGGISMLSFVAIGFFAFRVDNMTIAVMSVAVAGAILGFLRYNTHPAVVFMGDTGSQMLGFLCVVFTLVLTQANTPYSQITPLFLIGFPILDTLTVMVERIAKGGSPFKPDKNHFHHRLMKLGLYHSEAVLTIYLIQALFISCAFFFRFYSNWTNLALFSGLAFFIILLFHLARQTGFKFRSEVTAKGKKQLSVLALLAGERFSIRFFFKMLKWGLSGMMILQCLMPSQMPFYLSASGAVFAALIAVTRFFRIKNRGMLLRTMIYLTIPFLIYISNKNVADWVTEQVAMLNVIGFVGLVFCVIGVLNLTKRTKGFKFNPLDFLIFVVIIVFPNLPSIHLGNLGLKAMIAKSLILFFSYDVLMGELRKEYNFIDVSLMAVFLTIAARGFL
ncbi:glycosyltransferase family 4 protein [Desulfobacter latus]|uniref:Undecaprenyl/decaprenyl-phosphate alpha-N-acetylglucosaminyl 1-phosphate transferase n=1 Tax=Desulfobacter latus TaxID=2292 RepID=A0A850T625_9BACT|nr:MraY family glycosyltransferase [Desulfobacter latus]NWH03697.1 undecaprenyl/decaprenyl-phosphate alpha-N-acetylglucosaminyl 1-phosphate transferase [Desulfobacter latus]